MKYVVVHGSGLVDAPQPTLGERTALEAANTPALDALTRGGVTGSMTLAIDGAAVHSDLVEFAILGYDPKHYPGPAPFEAAGQGVVLSEMDVAYVCTMLTLRSGERDNVKKLGPHLLVEDDTAGGIETEQARELIDAVNEQLGSETIQFYPGSGHRHLMVWVGGKSRAVCVPPKDLLGRLIGDGLPKGDGSEVLRQLMEASVVILRDHPVNDERRTARLKPANCLWLWGQGRWPKVPSVTDRHQITGTIVSDDDVHRGVGVCAGLEPLESPTDGTPCVERALQELQRKDLVYVHVQLPDELAQSGDALARVKFIEEFDRQTVAGILEGLSKLGPYRLLAVCDSAPAERAAGPASVLYALSHGPSAERTPGKFGSRQQSAGRWRDVSKLLGHLLVGV